MAVPTETRRFAGEHVVRLLGRFAFQINHALKSPDPQAVHDLRVATRRFMQALKIWKPCFPGKEARRIRRRLKKIMTAAGEVRNYDVALKLLSKSGARDRTHLLLRLRSRRKEAQRVLVSLLKRWMERKSSLKWRSVLAAALAEARDDFCGIAIEETAGRALRGMTQDFLQRGGEASQAKASPRALHQFRIASKKFRYTLELFVPLYGPPLNRQLEDIKRTQTLLGDINDCVTVGELVAHYKGGSALADWLKKRQRKRTEVFRQYWRKEFGGRESAPAWIDSLRRLTAKQHEMKKPMASSRSASSNRRRGAVA